MAFSPPSVVQTLRREDPRLGSRNDSLYSAPLLPALKSTIFQQPMPPTMSRMSLSPIKPTHELGEMARPAPRPRDQKQVTFELLLPGPQSRARLPMRIMISKHDTTDSIITTVKNFYGLYDGPGVSFQDRQGNLLIGAYNNFVDGMTIYVKITEELSVLPADSQSRGAASPSKPKLGPAFEMRPPAPVYRAAFNGAARSPSPGSSASRRSPSADRRERPRSSRQQEPGAGNNDSHGEYYSDSDAGNGSVTSSRRSRAEAHASAEISVENIVEGGRRKRAKFESSVSSPRHLFGKGRRLTYLCRNCLSSCHHKFQ